MWYNIDDTLSHNCLFNFVVGPRGVGKTYSAKNRAIKNWLKKGEQFVYVRRYKEEVKQARLDEVFADIAEAYPDHEFTSKFKVFFCDGEIMGWAIPLSDAVKYKSTPFPKVTLIIFDEFIIDVGLTRYLPGEVKSFLELYSTIARLRDVTVVFLSNAITFTNPYFLYFDLEEPTAKNKIRKKGDILVQYVESPDYTKAASETRFGKIIEGTDYARYANENDFLLDNDKFIEQMPPGMNCRAIIKTDEGNFGLYSMGGVLTWYISEKYDKTCNFIISISTSAHDQNTTYVKGAVANELWAMVQQRYYVGKIRFTSMRVKNIISSKLNGRR